MYINNEVTFYNVQPEYNHSDHNLECLTIKITLPHQKPFLITTVYLPPKSDIKMAVKTLLDLFDNLNIINDIWIIGGDFNINYKKSPTNKNPQLAAFERHCILSQLITGPTRITQTVSSTIDLIFVNKPELISHSGIIHYGVSDHELTYCIHKKFPPPKIRSPSEQEI